MLRTSPLDQRGLNELVEFLALYKDHLPRNIWQDLSQSLQQKTPVDFTYDEPPTRFMKKAIMRSRQELKKQAQANHAAAVALEEN